MQLVETHNKYYGSTPLRDQNEDDSRAHDLTQNDESMYQVLRQVITVRLSESNAPNENTQNMHHEENDRSPDAFNLMTRAR